MLLNYRRDGTAFWNQVSISPVFDGGNQLVNFVGVQNDVTERVIVEQERRAALAEAEEARGQLRLLAEATSQMTAALDVTDACERLARSLVPALADLCAVDLLERPGERARRSGSPSRRGTRPTRSGSARLGRLRAYRGGDGSRTGDVLAGEQAAAGCPSCRSWAPTATRTILRPPRSTTSCGCARPWSCRCGPAAGCSARSPCSPSTRTAAGTPSGTCTWPPTSPAGPASPSTTPGSTRWSTPRRSRCSAACCPVVSDVDGVQVAARYLVGVDGNQVGGDWYDVLALPDGALGVAVGDVVGHDLRAAAAMGQLRGVLRSYAWDGGSPGSVLDRCDQLVQGLEMAAMATAVYARIEPPDASGQRMLRYANAGHPAPLLLRPDGELVRLDEHRSPMIGAVRSLGRRAGPGRTEAMVRCPPGAVLLLYTDGLTDVAGEDADERTDLLECTLAALPPGSDAETVVEQVLAACSLPAAARRRRAARGPARRLRC